ncbi:hypothetical protein, partial [Lacticaseibacillus manihotivorans]
SGNAGLTVIFDGEGLGILRYLKDEAVLVGFNATDRTVELNPQACDLHLVPEKWRDLIQTMTISAHSSVTQLLPKMTK